MKNKLILFTTFFDYFVTTGATKSSTNDIQHSGTLDRFLYCI